jgi:hypothetical protein
MTGDTWGIWRPFEVAFFSFLLATPYVRAAMPVHRCGLLVKGSKPDSKGLAEFLFPSRILTRQSVRLASGVTRMHYGVLLLCAGVFWGVASPTFSSRIRVA